MKIEIGSIVMFEEGPLYGPWRLNYKIH